MIFISILSMGMTGLLILFSFLAFTPSVTVGTFEKIFLLCLCVKACTWAPFIAVEYYDTIFEHGYHDVSWMLNPIDVGQAKLAKKVLGKTY